MQHLASTYRRLLDTMSTLAQPCAGGDTPSLALLTPGPYNETYFEHAYLARYLGLPLVEGCDLRPCVTTACSSRRCRASRPSTACAPSGR